MFDFSSLKARANQNDKKTAGTTGTTGTTNAGAGLRVPSTQNQNGDKRGQTTESTGKPAGNTGAALPFFSVPENLGTGKLANLSPQSPLAKNDAGTRKNRDYATDPSVPAVPAEKIANANETAKTTGERVELVRLMEAAMRACDFWGDGEEARQAMRQDVLHYPPTMRGELLDYFNSHYPPSPDISKHEQDKRP